ncbi:MAG: hypothetical protein NZM38_05750 [Cytophagales bacterium]|nr:hypothetical protein [Cytophagales bacterium]MDW8384259.1 hypothetical protein [Flammeovirgaceae bacterium]
MKLIKFLLIGISAFIIVLQLKGIYSANTDLTDASWIFMDENITFAGVKKLHQALYTLDKGYIIDQFLDGGDHRYGRILWIINALTSFIPSLIWGDKGVIVATRFTQAFFLVASYVILAHALLKSFTLRCVAVALLLLLPHTPYYATMPKPEPFQLFFIALFVWFASKKSFLLGNWYWIWLGAATGAKIATLPLVAFWGASAFGMALLGQDKNNQETAAFIKNLLKTIAWLIIGFNLAEPIFYIGPKIYWDWISGNVVHGEDNINLQFSDWFMFVINSWAGIHGRLMWIFLSLLVLISAFTFFQAIKGNHSYRNAGLVLAGGWLMNLFIMFTVKRLWGFYLQVGSALLVVGALAAFNLLYSQIHQKLVRFLGIILGLILVANGTILQLQYTKNVYEELATRTQNPQHIFKVKQQIWSENFINKLYRQKNKTLLGFYAPALYQFRIQPETALIRPIWGAFLDYSSQPDFIITDFCLLPDTVNLSENIFKDSFRKSAVLYGKHVAIALNDSCLAIPCYIETKIDSLKLFLYTQKTFP